MLRSRTQVVAFLQERGYCRPCTERPSADPDSNNKLTASDSETYLTHSVVNKRGEDQKVELIITTTSLYEVIDKDVVRRDFTEVTNVFKEDEEGLAEESEEETTEQKTTGNEEERVEADGPKSEKAMRYALNISFIQPSTKSSKVKVPSWGAGETASNYLCLCEYTFDSEEERDDCYTVAKNRTIDTWQAIFEEAEENAINQQEVYQGHFFVTKRNRKGKLQIRFLVFGTRSVYNYVAKVSVSRTKVEPNKCKWAFPIADIVAVVTYNDDPRAFSLEISTEASSKKKKVKSSITFLVDSLQEREDLLQLLQVLYWRNSGARLEKKTASVFASTKK
ncbi:Peptidase S1 domain-containing protein [Balamuthia mandrillaris]